MLIVVLVNSIGHVYFETKQICVCLVSELHTHLPCMYGWMVSELWEVQSILWGPHLTNIPRSPSHVTAHDHSLFISPYGHIPRSPSHVTAHDHSLPRHTFPGLLPMLQHMTILSLSPFRSMITLLAMLQHDSSLPMHTFPNMSDHSFSLCRHVETLPPDLAASQRSLWSLPSSLLSRSFQILIPR